METQLAAMATTAVAILTQVGLKVLGAIIIWVVGRRLIRFCQSLLEKALDRQHFDTTIVRYLVTSLGAVLTIALIIALLGFFGVETTTFAALLAGAGLAIGAAWSGLLSNFASGVFLVILRPFKVGDFISAGGVTGTVHAIGLFGTTVDQPDNVRTIVGNGKILNDNIQNFTANPSRRVELVAQLHYSVNPMDAMARLAAVVPNVANVLTTPAPEISILGFSDAGPQLAVRPYCNNSHYWQVYFDTNKLIVETFTAAGYPAPEHLYMVRTAAAAASANA